jgi:ABC-type enterochelin transport system ATPase subunit
MFTKLESRNESAKESGAMRLLQFKVTDFRSIGDSDWIDFAGVTALIGTNESGKTNLLLYLWKLNPAGEDGEMISSRTRHEAFQRDALGRPIRGVH